MKKKESWPRLLALTSFFFVELPGIEPELLPGKTLSGLHFRSNSFQFGTPRYLRFRFSGLDGVKSFRSARLSH
jgi:hypothetical protein